MGTSCFRHGVTPSSKRADKRLTALAEEKRLRDEAHKRAELSNLLDETKEANKNR